MVSDLLPPLACLPLPAGLLSLREWEIGRWTGEARRHGTTVNNPGSLANNYEALLNWVHEQPWFKAPRPDGPSQDRDIWDCRAALLDAFVYEEINGKLQPTR